MLKNAKLLAFDLDGTLLNSNKQIGERTVAAIRKAVECGIHVVLASGRMHYATAKFADQLNIPIDTPVISYNGGMVKTLSGKLIYERPVPAELAQYVIDFTDANDYHLNFYTGDVLYVKRLNEWSDLYERRIGSIPTPVENFNRFAGVAPTKLLLMDTLEKTNALVEPMQRHFGDLLYITKTENEYLEFMNPLATKGLALAAVARHLNIPRENVAAFGDNYNDIPMLEWAGWSVAMGNAKPEVKAAANQIAPTSDDDGIGQVLEGSTAGA
jgi:Cof subfamily protein (haloacid dehalogenase superfamily)